MTMQILADALWYGTLALIVLAATWTFGRQYILAQRHHRAAQGRLARHAGRRR